MSVRVRFAPSPTGFLHIGSLRTVLFNWLFARHHKGVFIVRVEDTDFERSKSEFEESIFQGMQWMGLNPDEGPEQGGPCGKYRQSERMGEGIYQAASDALIAKGDVYRCFCSESDLDREREESDAKNKAYVYSRKCLGLSDAEVKEKISKKIPFTLRFKLPKKEIIVRDLIKGELRFDAELISDFVIVRSDGTPSYNFAVVVDDHDMAISHVIRGVDHVSNTPKQIALYEALGYPLPAFAHFPMILGPDKTKLSKRHGATNVIDYKAQGFLPDALFNFLALLSWSSGSEQEIYTRDELAQLFSFDRVQKAGAVFDIVKLRWMNGMYIRALSSEQFYEQCQDFLTEKTKTELSIFSKEKQVHLFHSVQSAVDVLSDIGAAIQVYLKSDEDVFANTDLMQDSDHQAISTFIALAESSSWEKSTLEALIDDCMKKTGLGKGKVMKPLRLALTAEGSGPHLADLLYVLGQEVVLRRLKQKVSL